MLSRYYKGEEDSGFIRTHYFKKIEVENVDKNLLNLEKMFPNDDIFLDIHINEKENNNFDFFLNNIVEESVTNYLKTWSIIDVSNIYNYILYDNKYCTDVINDKKGYLILKLKYTNENKIITSYFKVNCRNAKWENEKKLWHIPLFYIFEMVKLTLFLGGSVSDTVLYHLCKLFNHFSSIKNVATAKMYELGRDEIQGGDRHMETQKWGGNQGIETKNGKEGKNEESCKLRSDKSMNSTKGTPIQGSTVEREYNFDVFVKHNKNQFIDYIKNVKMFKIEHIIINNIVNSDTMHVKILPYNEGIIKKIKEVNLFQWDKMENIWIIKKANFKNFYINVIKYFDFKMCSYYDYYKFCRQKLIDNEGRSNKIDSTITNLGNTKKKKKKRKIITDIRQNEKNCKHKMCYDSTDSSCSDELSRNVDSSYYEGRELVNKIKLVGAANNYYKDIIYAKLNKIKNLRPPNYTYDPKGFITKNGAGTKGIEIYDMPSDTNEWNKISFCIVPDEKKNIDLYDPKILCSLVSDVYLLKERAIDIVLKKYNKWPEYTDILWNTICSENEFIVCNKNFNTRQKLAHDRLFNKQFFYIYNIESVKQSNYYDPLFLCKTLITLGEGNIVTDPLDAEYIIIYNSNDPNAIDFYNSLQQKNKKKKLPLCVTPNFIYDCILNCSISYPSKNKNHFSFS
ncbi:conserved Plasmodium protein, unknown function [Plasmodium ovale]|uniref:BRCT domain-containing protein n=2 Tax=Plasmodium ovale TaxID=36330 RepID=A0A1D3KX45_PLAOA|nr:conserved Plasmodium protein, unknown function [Plasmodium ovale]